MAMVAVRAYVGYKAEKAGRLAMHETAHAKKIFLDAHHRAYPKLIHKFTPVLWSRKEAPVQVPEDLCEKQGRRRYMARPSRWR